jgi:hypothetical protein
MKLWRGCLAVVVAALVTLPSFAIIVVGGRNASGTLNNSGTNLNSDPFNLNSFTGRFGGFLGTAIGPKHIITATHVGSSGTFLYSDGGAFENSYNITLAGTLNDLAIYQIVGPQTFGHWIPIYTGSNEVGKQLVGIGNGTTRGNPVNTPSTSNLAGWEWGSGSTLRSWGINTATQIVDPALTGTFGGDYVYTTFTRNLDGGGNLLNPDSYIFSGGDSGGATFLFDDDGRWKLAGINSLVDQVSQTSNGPGYAAALFDARGFFDGPNLLDGPNPIPLGSYATRISSRQDFILGIVAVPEPSSMLLCGALALPGMGFLVLRRRGQKCLAR